MTLLDQPSCESTSNIGTSSFAFIYVDDAVVFGLNESLVRKGVDGLCRRFRQQDLLTPARSESECNLVTLRVELRCTERWTRARGKTVWRVYEALRVAPLGTVFLPVGRWRR